MLVVLAADVLEADAAEPGHEALRLGVQRLQPGCFTRYSPRICLTSSSESARIAGRATRARRPSSSAASRPRYSATLLVAIPIDSLISATTRAVGASRRARRTRPGPGCRGSRRRCGRSWSTLVRVPGSDARPGDPRRRAPAGDLVVEDALAALALEDDLVPPEFVHRLRPQAHLARRSSGRPRIGHHGQTFRHFSTRSKRAITAALTAAPRRPLGGGLPMRPGRPRAARRAPCAARLDAVLSARNPARPASPGASSRRTPSSARAGDPPASGSRAGRSSISFCIAWYSRFVLTSMSWSLNFERRPCGMASSFSMSRRTAWFSAAAARSLVEGLPGCRQRRRPAAAGGAARRR